MLDVGEGAAVLGVSSSCGAGGGSVIREWEIKMVSSVYSQPPNYSLKENSASVRDKGTPKVSPSKKTNAAYKKSCDSIGTETIQK